VCSELKELSLHTSPRRVISAASRPCVHPVLLLLRVRLLCLLLRMRLLLLRRKLCEAVKG
jgi:hypothetical protein